jgi:tRNA pseudouridine-54 N-methylase
MRLFLILFDDILIDKASVRLGQNSSEVVTACRCVNVGLFVSGNLRRDVIVSIAKGAFEDLKIVSFPGGTLKRVSPDERSISFFLLKAMQDAEGLQQNSEKILDNGIIVKREELSRFISGYSPNCVFIARNRGKPAIDPTLLLDDVILIYETRTPIDIAGLESRTLGNFKVHSSLPYPPHPERFIFDINELVDNVE